MGNYLTNGTFAMQRSLLASSCGVRKARLCQNNRRLCFVTFCDVPAFCARRGGGYECPGPPFRCNLSECIRSGRVPTVARVDDSRAAGRVPASPSAPLCPQVFPLEIRARAISVFWGLGTGAGGIAGPVLFGYLIEAAERAHHKGPIVIGYGVGAALMLAAAAVAACLGIDCEGQSLENIASDVHDIAVSGSADPLFGDGGYEGLSAAGPSSVGGAGHVQDQPWASEA